MICFGVTIGGAWGLLLYSLLGDTSQKPWAVPKVVCSSPTELSLSGTRQVYFGISSICIDLRFSLSIIFVRTVEASYVLEFIKSFGAGAIA